MSCDSTLAHQLLWKMKYIRSVEETIAQRYSEQKMRCPTHLCVGQEAIAAGVAGVLRKDDFMVSTHRAHGHYLAKGGSLKKMMAEIYGKSSGCSSGKGGSMHLIDKSVGFMGSTAIVGNTIPVGVGLGFSIQIQQTDQVSCVFFGDGAVEEGVFYESVNFAVLKQLPVLFICENNLYSVYSHLTSRQPEDRRIYKMIQAMGLESEQGDGNRVVEVYEKVRQAVGDIRQKKGPRFLEFSTYRWREHCGPNFDNNLGYRTEQEFLDWKDYDPITLFEQQLLQTQTMTVEQIEKFQTQIDYEVEEAFQFAEESFFPHPEEAFSHLFKE